ncbi:MAG: hypothetical protein ACE5E3_02255 [Mariprofundus sp.]
MHRLYCALVIALMLAGCQTGKGKFDHAVDDLLIKGSEAFNIMNTYAVIQHDFKRGRIMRARARVLAMDKSHRDYDKSYKLLKQKIEPARRRVFVHYLRTAKRHEKNRAWSKAMWAYDQARAVTIKPEIMAKKYAEMEVNMRQLRFKTLRDLRRKEDRILLADARAYEAPRGIDPKDDVYGRMREHYNDMLDDRANRAFREARRFLRKGLPEIAYIEIESYMFLQPGTTQGQTLLAEIRRAMPKTLVIAAVEKSAAPKQTVIKRIAKPKEVTAKQVQSAVKSGKLVEARQLAQIYRRNGGKGADKLLAQIEKKLKAQAVALFAKGSRAFQKEQLVLAIQHWTDAVALVPEESEYVEALRRAKQLQERLSLLQNQHGAIAEEE